MQSEEYRVQIHGSRGGRELDTPARRGAMSRAPHQDYQDCYAQFATVSFLFYFLPTWTSSLDNGRSCWAIGRFALRIVWSGVGVILFIGS
jgi:hypothetical protein